MDTNKDIIVIDFTANGEVHGMHHDKFPLGFLGKQEIKRASEITFNEQTQLWDIALPVAEGKWEATSSARGFAGYDIARGIEVKWLEHSRLAGVAPLSPQGINILEEVKGNGLSALSKQTQMSGNTSDQ